MASNCPRCGIVLPEVAPPPVTEAVVGNSSPREADDHEGRFLPALGFLRTTLGLVMVVVVASGAGALCLIAPTAFGVGLFALAAMLSGFALLRWAWTTITLKTALAALGLASSHQADVASRQSTNWTNGIGITLAFGVALFVHRYQTNQRTEEKRLAAAVANEKYWRDAVLSFFQQEDLPIESDQTLSSVLKRDLVRERATIAYVRQQPTFGVDGDLVQAVTRWIGARERLNKWMEQNTPLLLDAGRGLTPQQLTVPNGPDFLELAHRLPTERLSPELAELRSISLELDVSISELERVQVRLSDRYRDRSFPSPSQ